MALPHDHESRLALYLLSCERKFIEDSLVRHKGCVADVARELGLSLRHAYSKMAEHGLTPLAQRLQGQIKSAAWRQVRESLNTPHSPQRT